MENPEQSFETWPNISVIIPVFNCVGYIGGAIRSCLEQLGPLDEIVVIDDGSSDGTAEILCEFARHPQVRVLKQTNQGVSSARNFGVRVSTGSFVAFLDADDEFLSHTLNQFQLAIISHPNIDVFFADYWISDIPGLRYSAHNQLGADCMLAPYIETVSGGVASLRPGFAKAYATDKLARTIVHTDSIIIRRSLFDRTGGFMTDLRVGEDLNLWARCFANGQAAVLGGEPQSVYFRWRGSTEKYEHVCEDKVRRLREAIAVVPPFSTEWRRLRRQMAREYLNLIYWIGIDRSPRAILARALWRSVICYPILSTCLRYAFLLLLPRPIVRRLYFIREFVLDWMRPRVRTHEAADPIRQTFSATTQLL